MPHLIYGAAELDVLYPSIEVPIEEELDDEFEKQNDERDTVFQHGKLIAEQIANDMSEFGRLRHGHEDAIGKIEISSSQSLRSDRHNRIISACNFVSIDSVDSFDNDPTVTRSLSAVDVGAKCASCESHRRRSNKSQSAESLYSSSIVYAQPFQRKLTTLSTSRIIWSTLTS